MAVFDVLLDVFVNAGPTDSVAQSLSHLYGTGVTFVRELKDLLAKACKDDCLATHQAPVPQPLRRVPLALLSKVKEELDRMVRDGCLKQIDDAD